MKNKKRHDTGNKTGHEGKLIDHGKFKDLIFSFMTKDLDFKIENITKTSQGFKIEKNKENWEIDIIKIIKELDQWSLDFNSFSGKEGSRESIENKFCLAILVSSLPNIASKIFFKITMEPAGGDILLSFLNKVLPHLIKTDEFKEKVKNILFFIEKEGFTKLDGNSGSISYCYSTFCVAFSSHLGSGSIAPMVLKNEVKENENCHKNFFNAFIKILKENSPRIKRLKKNMPLDFCRFLELILDFMKNYLNFFCDNLFEHCFPEFDSSFQAASDKEKENILIDCLEILRVWVPPKENESLWKNNEELKVLNKIITSFEKNEKEIVAKLKGDGLNSEEINKIKKDLVIFDKLCRQPLLFVYRVNQRSENIKTFKMALSFSVAIACFALAAVSLVLFPAAPLLVPILFSFGIMVLSHALSCFKKLTEVSHPIERIKKTYPSLFKQPKRTKKESLEKKTDQGQVKLSDINAI